MTVSRGFLLQVALLVIVSVAFGQEVDRAYQFKDDYESQPLTEQALEYYYYTPCPTYSWFWAYWNFERYGILGAWFEIGDMSMGPFEPCDPLTCHTLDQFRILDLAGYGCYPPLYDQFYWVEFDIYCADENGCPVGPSLWNSGEMGTCYGWNYIPVDPPISICGCSVDPGPPPIGPRVLVTATLTALWSQWVTWGVDNISKHVIAGCVMHDEGCQPVLYPRPYVSHYPTMHSGYYGIGFEHCPPEWFRDGRDTTPDATDYGYCELAWRIYVSCSGPSQIWDTSWGQIKNMFR